MKTWMLLTLMGIAALAHGAEMYRWIDEKGIVNYTPYPPPEKIKKVEQKKLGSNAAQAQPSETPYSVQLAAKNFPTVDLRSQERRFRYSHHPQDYLTPSRRNRKAPRRSGADGAV